MVTHHFANSVDPGQPAYTTYSNKGICVRSSSIDTSESTDCLTKKLVLIRCK